MWGFVVNIWQIVLVLLGIGVVAFAAVGAAAAITAALGYISEANEERDRHKRRR